MPASIDLVHVDVTVSTLDPPGGRIAGTFSVVRGKDRVIE